MAETPPQMKQCRACSQEKPAADYRKHAAKCRPCEKAAWAPPTPAQVGARNASRRAKYAARRGAPAVESAWVATAPGGAVSDSRIQNYPVGTADAPQPSALPPQGPVQTIVILTDMHVPEHDRPMWRAVREFLRANQPDEIILNGDFGEFSSVSRHGGTLQERLTDDFAHVKRALNELREDAPGARIVYMEGNHETRLERTVGELMPAMAGTVTVPGGLDLAERGIQYVAEHQQPIKRGKLRVLHGHQFGGKYGSKHHAMRAADLYGGEPGVVSVHGHTHVAQSFSRAVMGGAVTAFGLGCGRTIGAENVRWLHGREAGWSHQFAVCHVAADFAQVYPVTVTNGRFVWGGRLYGGA